MQGTVLYGPRDVRFEDRPDPKIIEPTDAILRIAATCVCRSTRWRRATAPWTSAAPSKRCSFRKTRKNQQGLTQ
jgi:threonine dehydrogenase-like Zn-dependent dehydrogenase